MIVNEKKCINVAGVGFDGYVAKLFKENKKRGFVTYSKIVLNNFNKFKSREYKLIIDEKEYLLPAFLISIANSSQFGNNAHIAPKASISDGFLNISVLEKIPVYSVPLIITKLFTRKIDTSKYYKGFIGKSIVVSSNEKIFSHIDGEYLEQGNLINIRIKPNSLNVICNNIGKN
jgi:diacylglycerol kinase family enzyme